MSKLCSNCQKEPGTYRGLCQKCYVYQNKNKRPRPEWLYNKAAREGEKGPAFAGKQCLCGKAATVMYTLSTHPGNKIVYYDEPLCDECAAIERSLTYVCA